MSYTQFACSDFLRVLVQVQVDTEFRKKKIKQKKYSSVGINNQPKTDIPTDGSLFRIETASQLHEGRSDAQL